jgi:hypothetical protein
VANDDDVVHTHVVESAEYNAYQDGRTCWLTLQLQAAATASNEHVDLATLEINVPFDQHPASLLRPGQSIVAASYHETYHNLTNLYYLSHHPFDGTITVEQVASSALSLVIRGESDPDRVLVQATFRRNSGIKRTFS